MRFLNSAWILSLALAAPAAAQEHVVVISVDGLRPEFYLENRYETPTLKRWRERGVHARAVEGVFPSVTYASHASIVTGVRPHRHGVYGNTVFGEMGATRAWYWETKDLRADPIWRVAKRAGKKVSIIYWPSSVGADVDWRVPERWAVFRGENHLSLLTKLSTPKLFGELLVAAGIPKNLSDYAEIDRFITRSAAHVLTKYRPNLLFVHLIQVDGAQHKTGRDGAKVLGAVRQTDANLSFLEEAAAKAGMKGKTTFIVVGDHGFLDVQSFLAPNVLLRQAGLIQVEKGKVVGWGALGHAYGGSMGIYAKTPAVAKRARAILEAAARVDGRKRFSILDRGELDRLGANPGLAFALEAEPGFGFTGTTQGEFTGRRPWAKGQHGYLPTRPELATGFVAFGAGIKAGRIEKMRLIDIAPTLARFMGLEMKGVEGRVLQLGR